MKDEFTRQQVRTAALVIERCSKDDLFVLTKEAMKRAANENLSLEICHHLSVHDDDEFDTWESSFLNGE